MAKNMCLVSCVLAIHAFFEAPPFFDSALYMGSDGNDDVGKFVYIDLSLPSTGVPVDGDLLFVYVMNETADVPLVFIGDGIYKTSQRIPIGVFSSEENGFSIKTHESGKEKFCSTFINGNNPLQNEGYDYVCLGDSIDASVWTVIGYGQYSGKTENLSATADTQRIWVTFSDIPLLEITDFWEAQTRPAVAFNDNGRRLIVLMDCYVNSFDGASYYFADIPYQVTEFSILVMSGPTNHNSLVYFDTGISRITYGVRYHCFQEEGMDAVTLRPLPVINADANLLGLVVEAYLTHGKRESNGAASPTVSSLFFTWFENKAATEEELKKTIIQDYTEAALVGGEYDANLPKDGQFSVDEKWKALCLSADVNPVTGMARSRFSIFDSNFVVFVFVLAGSVLVSLLVWLVFLALRKQEHH